MLKFDDGGTSPFRRVKYLGEHACPIFESATAQQAKISMGPEHLRLKVEFCFKFSSQVAPPQAKDGDLVLACDFDGP